MNKYIIIGVLILALIIYAYVKGKNKGPGEEDLPMDMQPTNVGDGKGWNVGNYTDALHKDIYSYGMRNDKIWLDTVILSNSQLGAIYNDWNKRYYSKDKETITQAISGEWAIAPKVQNAMTTIVKRLESLGFN